jgi:hypothetical protein
MEDAEKNDNSLHAKAIVEIMHCESQKKLWRRISYTTRPSWTQTSVELYDTEETMVGNASDHLSIQFYLAYLAPLYSSKILQEIGHLGDTECAQEFLNGTYTYPDDTKKWTQKIMEESHHTFQLLAHKKN